VVTSDAGSFTLAFLSDRDSGMYLLDRHSGPPCCGDREYGPSPVGEQAWAWSSVALEPRNGGAWRSPPAAVRFATAGERQSCARTRMESTARLSARSG